MTYYAYRLIDGRVYVKPAKGAWLDDYLEKDDDPTVVVLLLPFDAVNDDRAKQWAAEKLGDAKHGSPAP